MKFNKEEKIPFFWGIATLIGFILSHYLMSIGSGGYNAILLWLAILLIGAGYTINEQKKMKSKEMIEVSKMWEMHVIVAFLLTLASFIGGIGSGEYVTAFWLVAMGLAINTEALIKKEKHHNMHWLYFVGAFMIVAVPSVAQYIFIMLIAVVSLPLIALPYIEK